MVLGLLDLWTLGHAFVGVLFGFILAIKNYSFKKAFWITFIATVLWEIYERTIVLAGESYSNSMSDIIVALLFFYASYFLVYRNRKEIVDIWFTKHDGFFDMWSLVHLLAGTILAILFLILDIKINTSIIISSIIFVSWELYERITKVGESVLNQFSDILFGYLGFFFAVYLLFESEKQLIFAMFILASLMFVALKEWGTIQEKTLVS